MAEQSEYDRQMAVFNKKIQKPDRVIKAHSVMHSEAETGDIYWFLSNDDTLIMVDMREEEDEQEG